MTISPGTSETFDITFSPASLGSKVGSLIIQSNDDNNGFFVLNTAGEGVDVLPNQIMISQYYDGFGGNDNWIEVTNISGGPLDADTFFLALYDENSARVGIIENQAPNANIAIPAMTNGETLLFRNVGFAVICN